MAIDLCKSTFIKNPDEFTTYVNKTLKLYNILYFDGKLDISGLKLYKSTNSRVVSGLKRNKRRALGFDLMINYFYSDFKQYHAVLLHELIHVYQLQILKMSWEDIMSESASGHGNSFMRKALQIKLDYNIDTYEELYDLVNEYADAKRCG